MSSKSGSKESTDAKESSLVLGLGGASLANNASSVADPDNKKFTSHAKDWAMATGGKGLDNASQAGKNASEAVKTLASNAFNQIKNAGPISDLF